MATRQNIAYRTALDVAADLTNPVSRKVMEILNQSTAWFNIMPMIKGNKPEGHLVEVRSQLPTSYMVSTGQGAVPSAAGSQLVTYKFGLGKNIQKQKLEVAALGEGVEAYMNKHAPAHVQSLYQMVGQQIHTGDPAADPNDILGLTNIFTSLTGNMASNTIGCGGSGSTNTEAFFLGLGEEGFAMTYPDDGQAGIHADKPTIQWAEDSTTGEAFKVIYREWAIKFGIQVGDWTNLVAYVNIDVPTLRDGTSALDLLDKFRRAPYLVGNENMPGAWVMNKSLMMFLDSQLFNKLTDGGGLTRQETVTGKMMPHFNGYPVIPMPAIANTLGTKS